MRTFTFVFIFIALFTSIDTSVIRAEESYSFGEQTYLPTFRFTQNSWFTMPHPRVISFSVREDGSAIGLTETGIVFTQYNVPNSAGIRVQRFEIEDHFHYIIEGEIVYSFTEFSARLAQAYLSKSENV